MRHRAGIRQCLNSLHKVRPKKIQRLKHIFERKVLFLIEAIDRVDILKDCDNVNYIDIVDACTGEVMVTIKSNEVEYIAADVPVRLCYEVMLNY